MIDLHCHILPNVDDGAASLDEALTMARFFVQDGITHVAATPHCHRQCRMLRTDVLPLVARFNQALAAAGIPLSVLPGSEIQVTDTTAFRRDYDAGLFCHLGDRLAFTLFEFSWKPEQYPADATELIAWLRKRGTIPILAHPERYGFFTANPGRLPALVDAGAWIQVTVDSLLGNHGLAPKAAADLLLRRYPDAVLATDAHNLRRCSGLSAGFSWVREHVGAECAERLTIRADKVLAAIVQDDDESRRGSPSR